MYLPIPLVFAVQQGITAALKLDPHTKSSLSAIDSKVIRVEVVSPAFTFHLIVVDNDIQVEGEFDGDADVTLHGTAASLLSLRDKTDALYTGDVTIRGELETADQLKKILTGIDIQIEDIAAPITGDTIAHQIGRFGQQFGAWFSSSSSSFKQSTSDYLQEEAELLAPNSEVNRYCREVDEVREQADRLDARIAELERQKNNSDSSHD